MENLINIGNKIKPHFVIIHRLEQLGWVDLDLMLFHHLPGSAWADGKLAKLAEKMGKLVDLLHNKSKSTQPNFPSRCITSKKAGKRVSHIIKCISNAFRTGVS